MVFVEASVSQNTTVIYTVGDANMVSRVGHYELARATFDREGNLLESVNMTDVSSNSVNSLHLLTRRL